MRASRSFQSLAFRVYLKPAPRTQSESNAILRYIHDLGPITTFRINRSDDSHDNSKEGATADLVFANDSRKLDSLRTRYGSTQFTVTVNENIPNAHVLDPFNVRGLKNRKPELQSRDIHCEIVPLSQKSGIHGRKTDSLATDLSKSQLSDKFSVDRGSIFGEILAKTDCPSGLIQGLLPRLDEKFRPQTHPLVSSQPAQIAKNGDASGAVLPGSYNHKPGSYVQFVPVKLDSAETAVEPNIESTKATNPDLHGNSNLHDEFADLRGVSLLQMYRATTGSDPSANNASGSLPKPFSNGQGNYRSNQY